MKRFTIQITITLAALVLTLSSCNQGQSSNEETTKDSVTTMDEMAPTEMDEAPKVVAVADLISKSGSDLTGQVSFTEHDGQVTMKAQLQNVSPSGKHAIHIHEKGDCSASDGTSAGGHWNPTNVDHGKWGTQPHHQGDIGNLMADGAGNAELILTTDAWCITCDDANKNIVGKAVIVHEGADDFTSQPSGAAGKRIGCAEIVVPR